MYILVSLLVVSVALAGVRWWKQLQTARPMRIDRSFGIDEGFFVEIGGIEQWIQIRGDDRRNPILLFLHGGPGVSYVPFAHVFREWERHFTVVHWDQRGAGKSFRRNGKRGTGELSVERMAADGIEVAEEVARMLGQPKVILFCHSWGSVLGLAMAGQRPDLFHAYVGAGQVVAMSRSEPLSYDLLLREAEVRGDAKAVTAIKALGPPPYKDKKTWMMKQRLIVMTAPPPPEGEHLPDIFGAPMVCPGYSLLDSIAWFRAFGFSVEKLYDAFMSFEAVDLGRTYELPMLILQGVEDLQAPHATAKEYFASVTAPAVQFVSLPGEGHTGVLSNPRLILDHLLSHVRPLADASTVEATSTATRGGGERAGERGSRL